MILQKFEGFISLPLDGSLDGGGLGGGEIAWYCVNLTPSHLEPTWGGGVIEAIIMSGI